MRDLICSFLSERIVGLKSVSGKISSNCDSYITARTADRAKDSVLGRSSAQRGIHGPGARASPCARYCGRTFGDRHGFAERPPRFRVVRLALFPAPSRAENTYSLRVLSNSQIKIYTKSQFLTKYDHLQPIQTLLYKKNF